MTISGNANLKTLTGLENLKSLQQLTISGNDKLTTLSGIENLKSLQQLTILGNYKLTTFDLSFLYKLENLEEIDIDFLKDEDIVKLKKHFPKAKISGGYIF